MLIDSANDLNIVHESVVTPTALSVAQPCLANTKGIGGETTFEKVVYVGIQPPDKSYILWVSGDDVNQAHFAGQQSLARLDNLHYVGRNS